MPEQRGIQDVVEAYAAAVLARDAEAFAGLYGHDVRVFDTWGQWSYEGAEAWCEMARGWFASLGDERIVVRVDDLRTVARDGLAVAHAYVTYAATDGNGDEVRSMTNRLTWALERVGAGWTIVHEHTSAPADFETAKVMLQR